MCLRVSALCACVRAPADLARAARLPVVAGRALRQAGANDAALSYLSRALKLGNAAPSVSAVTLNNLAIYYTGAPHIPSPSPHVRTPA